jgi:hypothetical protein
MATYEAALAEIRKNIEAYRSVREKLLREHLGRIALFHDGQLIATYNDHGDAYDIGCEKFGLGNFALKRIGEQPGSLGAATLYVEPVALR